MGFELTPAWRLCSAPAYSGVVPGTTQPSARTTASSRLLRVGKATLRGGVRNPTLLPLCADQLVTATARTLKPRSGSRSRCSKLRIAGHKTSIGWAVQ
jgi:hypothetical protein